MSEKERKEYESKMKMWHTGERGLNVSACGDDKLRKYHEICKNKGYTLEARRLEMEMKKRGLTPGPIILEFEELDKYIKEKIKEKSRKDLHSHKDENCTYYGWTSKGKDLVDDHICRLDHKRKVIVFPLMAGCCSEDDIIVGNDIVIPQSDTPKIQKYLEDILFCG